MDKELLKEKLKQLFNILQNDDYYIYELKMIEKEYNSYFISEGNWKGVAIPIYNNNLILKGFLANFENLKVCIKNKIIENNKSIHLLCLLSKNKTINDNFILLCMDFLDPGENGKNRNNLVNNPQIWVDSWNKLLGNKSEDDMDYSYLGELIVLNYLLKKDKNIEMTNQGSHDLESLNMNYEIKTTILRYISTIEVHSQYQLKKLNNNPLELYFVRLEESIDGVSINSVLKNIEKFDYNIDKIEKKIENISTKSREKKYKILEVRKYDINEKFPQITANSFKDNEIPKNIINIKYVINLDGLEYENIQI